LAVVTINCKRYQKSKTIFTARTEEVGEKDQSSLTYDVSRGSAAKEPRAAKDG
jgi:hypothetical protein